MRAHAPDCPRAAQQGSRPVCPPARPPAQGGHGPLGRQAAHRRQRRGGGAAVPPPHRLHPLPRQDAALPRRCAHMGRVAGAVCRRRRRRHCCMSNYTPVTETHPPLRCPGTAAADPQAVHALLLLAREQGVEACVAACLNALLGQVRAQARGGACTHCCCPGGHASDEASACVRCSR